MSRTVERHKDQDGHWWVLENGSRKCFFATRAEARLYASGGLDVQPQQESSSRKTLLELCENYGTERIQSLYRKLDPLDVRIINFHLAGATQMEVARNIGLSQPSVCYRLQQVWCRLRFLLEFPEIDPKQMREDLLDYFDDMDITILIMFVQTTCQSLVAQRLGVSQGFVRHRVIKAVGTLASLPELAVYHKAVSMAQENLNVLNAHPKPKELEIPVRVVRRKPVKKSALG